VRIGPAAFARLVGEALDAIPDEFARHLANVAVVVEDAPSPALLRGMGLDPHRDTLYGLYQGIPLPERTGDPPALPDRIVIYSAPLLRDCRTVRTLKREIRVTVVHELAHAFGLDDGLIRRYGY